MEKSQYLNVRVTDDELALIEAERSRLLTMVGGIRVSKSDALRSLIVRGSAASSSNFSGSVVPVGDAGAT